MQDKKSMYRREDDRCTFPPSTDKKTRQEQSVKRKRGEEGSTDGSENGRGEDEVQKRVKMEQVFSVFTTDKHLMYGCPPNPGGENENLKPDQETHMPQH